MSMKNYGSIAFIVGLVLAAIIALFSALAVPMWAVIVLAVLGLIVGLLNISDKETSLFLVASVTFLLSFQALSSVLETLAFGWEAVGTFFRMLNVFIAPAAAVVAIKAIMKIAKD